MKEASQNAVENARSILAQSLLAENAIDVESLAPSDVEDLKLATGATLASLKRILLAPILEKMEERNLRLPVNQLSLEILERIFQEYLWLMRLSSGKPDSVYKYDTGVYSQAALSLALVSKRWHRIVFGTPSFWTLVSLAMPHAQVDKWLSLSGSRPLDVYCEKDRVETNSGASDSEDLDSDDPDSEGSDSENFQTDITPKGLAAKASLLKFIKAVGPHLGRSRLIRVAVPRDWIQHSLPMFSTPNGTIETLELHLRYGRRGSGFHPAKYSSLALFQHHAPKLTCVEITSIQIDWRSLTYLPALRTLKLSGVTIPTSCIQENGLKESLTRLRVLELREVFMGVDVPAQGVLLDLPNLQRLVCTLHLYDLPDSWGAPLISRIRSLHSLETINMSVNPDSKHGIDREAYFEANFAHISSDLSRILGSAACIHINSNGLRVSISDTAGSFRFEFTNMGYDFLSRRFRDIFLENEVSGNVDLSLREYAMYAIRRDTWEWPHLNVSRLTLKDDPFASQQFGELPQILISLGDFLKDPHHWSTLRCIRLDFKQLRLDRFTACLKERYSGTHNSSVDLQHLDIFIKCLENSTSSLEELRETHGVDSVILQERGANYVSTAWDDEERRF